MESRQRESRSRKKSVASTSRAFGILDSDEEQSPRVSPKKAKINNTNKAVAKIKKNEPIEDKPKPKSTDVIQDNNHLSEPKLATALPTNSPPKPSISTSPMEISPPKVQKDHKSTTPVKEMIPEPSELSSPIKEMQEPVQFSTAPFSMSSEPSSAKPRVLLALTGSVAAIKLNEILKRMTKIAEVIVIATKSAVHFLSTHGNADPNVRFYNDESEYAMWKDRGDPVLHIELRKWADVFLIAPLSANTLAKLAGGICDNLVTCVARAWDFERPILIAPAMNTLMWTHPFTSKHLGQLEEIGFKVIKPIEKTLMCGDVGNGAMAEVSSILEEVQTAIKYYPRKK